MVQLDFLEHPAIEDVIIMSVVLEEVRHQNQSAYQRLRTLTAASDRRFFVFSNEHHRCREPLLVPDLSSSMLACSVPAQTAWLWMGHH